MGQNRDLVLEHCNPAMELGFSTEDFNARLQAIRKRMAADKIDLLWLMAPESLYHVSGYTCEWYQAQSPKQWPATSGIAVHADHDRFILFDTPSEKVMCRFVTCAEDIRTFPIDNRRDGIGFIMEELKAEGWLGGAVGMEFFSYRPNPAITLPVLSGLKANTGHSLASRKVIAAGAQVNVDVSGVYWRYHANAARAFHVGEPAKDVLDYHNKSSGVFEVIAKLLKPGLTVGELVVIE